MTQSKDEDITFTLELSNLEDNITIDTTNMAGYDLSDYVTDTIDISTITAGTWDVKDWDRIGNITLKPTMWEDCMPDPQKLKKMCEQYPALAKVYENFKTVYSMVEQDWKGNYDDEDELPF